MNFRLTLVAASLAAAVLAAPTGFAALPATPVTDSPVPSLAPMVKRITPSVVNIATRGTIKEKPGQRNPLMDDPFFRRFFDTPPDSKPRERQFQSAGSGVIVDAKNGYIITNHHVVENASEITITLLDNRSFTAKVVGSDEGADIAVLQAKQPNLVAMPLGDSAHLEVGDFVVAIGNPFGLQHTVTAGIVSALGRSGINPEGYEDFIQTDASINPGNSGGPLLNLKGDVIGINTAIFSQSGGSVGIGFAIPINMVKRVVDQLVDKGKVVRGWLGVALQPLSLDLAQSLGLEGTNGAVVGSTITGSPAAQAGLEQGDVIVAFDKTPVEDYRHVQRLVAETRVGKSVTLQIVRKKQKMDVTVMIAEVPEDSGRRPGPPPKH